jgi:predicted nucleotidyltransferase
MGTKENIKSGIGEALFTKTQRQVLGLLFGNPDKSYYAKEIVRYAEVGIGTVQRELEKLASAGLLTTEKVGNQKHYQANRQSPIFEELKGLVQKTFGLADILKGALSGLKEQIKVAFVFGSIAKGEDVVGSDIDIMIVSEDLSYPDVIEMFSRAETRLGRTINPSIYTPSELNKKLSEGSSFVVRVLDQEKLILIGSENDLPKP